MSCLKYIDFWCFGTEWPSTVKCRFVRWNCTCEVPHRCVAFAVKYGLLSEGVRTLEYSKTVNSYILLGGNKRELINANVDIWGGRGGKRLVRRGRYHKPWKYLYRVESNSGLVGVGVVGAENRSGAAHTTFPYWIRRGAVTCPLTRRAMWSTARSEGIKYKEIWSILLYFIIDGVRLP